ncbi:MAG: hypothetical protein IPG45_33535 [Deltaproteobacteria bacterium]|nr:hypothetical protein [Deltaproteobacteria bacterium]
MSSRTLRWAHWGLVGWALAALQACGSAGAIIATEDLGEADLKVMITRSDQRENITVLAADAPFIYRQEPLLDVFDRGGQLRVIVVGLRSQDLRAAYPNLPDRPPAELAQQLVPRLGPIGGGLYPPPTPTKVLATTVLADSNAALEYQNTDLATLGDEAAFGFALPGDLLCPPIGAQFRVFDRDDPTKTCVFRRDSQCTWRRQGQCPNDQVIFGVQLPAERSIFQLPDGVLVLPTGERCQPIAARQSPIFGETRAWRCGDQELGAQEQSSASTLPYVTVNREDLRTATLFAPGTRGTYLALGPTNFARLKVSSGRADLETLVVLGVDSGANARSLTRVDETRVRLNNTFNSQVVEGMCLSVGGDHYRIQGVEDSGGGTRDQLVLSRPVAAFSPTVSWNIYGDPSQGTSSSPTFELPSGAGTATRLSADGADRLVISTSQGTFDTLPIRSFNRRFHYECAYPVVQPPDRSGEAVAGSTGYLALAPDRLLVQGADGVVSRTIPLGETLPAGARILRLDEDYLAVAVLGSTRVIVVGPTDQVSGYDLPGALIGMAVHQFAPSPRSELYALYQPNDSSAELRLLALATQQERRYLVPPFDESANPADARIRIEAEAFYDKNGRLLVAYGQGKHTGAIDLLSGLSVAFRMGDEARSQVTFLDDLGTSGWALSSGSTTSAVFRLP